VGSSVFNPYQRFINRTEEGPFNNIVYDFNGIVSAEGVV
jgi:hypothetical protein